MGGSEVEREHVLQLEGTRQDAARARSFLRELLPGLGWESRLDDACLLVSELVANVALHAQTAASVSVTGAAQALLVAVDDASSVLPRLSRFSDQSTTGRGLRLVQQMADRWGAERSGVGKRVWFCFDRVSATGGSGASAFAGGAAEGGHGARVGHRTSGSGPGVAARLQTCGRGGAGGR